MLAGKLDTLIDEQTLQDQDLEDRFPEGLLGTNGDWRTVNGDSADRPEPDRSPFAIRHSPFAIRHSPFTVRRFPFAFQNRRALPRTPPRSHAPALAGPDRYL